jgi:hypothetical protein
MSVTLYCVNTGLRSQQPDDTHYPDNRCWSDIALEVVIKTDQGKDTAVEFTEM